MAAPALTPEARRQSLRDAAKGVELARELLASIIRDASAEGLSLRVIAAEVGLSPEQVRRIVQGLA